MSAEPHTTRRLVFIALWLGMMIGAMGSTLAASLGSSMFKDVKAGSPYDAAIGEMVQLGIMQGTSKNQFKPNASIKRGELALILKKFRDSLRGTDLSIDSGSTESSAASSSAASQASASSFKAPPSSLAYNPAGYIRFTTTTFSINESLGTATVTLVRTGGNQGTVSVDYIIVPGTAVAGTDYVDSSGTLTFAAKETSKKIQIQVKDDGKSTPERTLFIELKNPKSAGIANPARATLKILDRFATTSTDGGTTTTSAASSAAPTTPILSFSASMYSVGEDGGSIAITVVRSGVTSTAVNATYATSNGSATANDNTPATGTVSFAASETSKTFTVTIPNDSSVDGNRTVNLLLSNPTNGGVIGSPGSSTLTIYDDETAAFGSGSIKFSKAKYEVSEGSGKAVVTIMRAGGAKGAATVQYAAAGGSATDGTDFTPVSGTMTFAAGEASKTFEVPIMKDTTGDGGENVVITLSNVTGATMGDPVTGTIVIYD